MTKERKYLSVEDADSLSDKDLAALAEKYRILYPDRPPGTVAIPDRPMEPATPAEAERAKKANEELARGAAERTYVEQRIWLRKQINKKHKYRGADKAGNVHEDAKHPGLKFKVVVTTPAPLPNQHLLGGDISADPTPPEVLWCANETQALNCVINAAKEGKSAEIIPMAKVEDDGHDMA